ncbi:hypothetical protein LEP1GSC109_1663 [Leptospira interrogans str. UI 13372]|nr:hypothetical protein LEP1GSC109_1663 [Leptospira interrogans str. UI 13372]
MSNQFEFKTFFKNHPDPLSNDISFFLKYNCKSNNGTR